MPNKVRPRWRIAKTIQSKVSMGLLSHQIEGKQLEQLNTDLEKILKCSPNELFTW